MIALKITSWLGFAINAEISAYNYQSAQKLDIKGHFSLKLASSLSPLLLMLVLLIPQSAQASLLSPLTLSASMTVQNDSNIFRLSSHIPTSALANDAKRNDQVWARQISLRLDERYSLQRILVEASRTDYRYQQHQFLNFAANNYQAHWFWALTPEINGQLGLQRDIALVNYADYQGNYNQPNLRTLETRHFNTELSHFGPIHLMAGLLRQEQHNSLYFEAEGAYIQEDRELGLTYKSPAGNQIRMFHRQGNGHYTDRQPDPANQFDPTFKQSQNELQLDWQFSSLSSFHAQLGHKKREHPLYARNDYQGRYASLQYDWSITPKIRLNWTSQRDVLPYQTLFTSHYILHQHKLNISWAVLPKLSLQLRMQNDQRRYQAEFAIPFAQRNDMIQLRDLGILWTPYDFLTSSIHLSSDKRHSNLSGADYASHQLQAALNAQF